MGNGNEVEHDVARKRKFESNGDFLEGTTFSNPNFKDSRASAESERDISQLANQPVANTVAQAQTTGGVSDSLTTEAEEHLSTREGFRRDVYNDSEGKPTAGTGHLMSAAELAIYPVGSIVPDSVLEQWREEDSTEAYSAAYMMASEIGVESQALVNALTAMNFQLGTAWNEEHKKTWGYLVAQDWKSAAAEAADSQWFEQTPVRVLDFQRALLTLAGEPTDYQSMVAFNADNVAKRGAVMPTETSMNQFVPTAETTETVTPTPEKVDDAEKDIDTTKAPTTAEPATSNLEISAPVGLAEDGNSHVGNSADVRTVQQQLVYAGFLPEEVMSRSGAMVTTVDGLLGGQTIAAIHSFQSSVMGFRTTDGRVDVGGKTWNKLMSYSASVVVEEGVSESDQSGGSVGGTDSPVTTEQEQEETVVADTAHSDEHDTADGGETISEQVVTSFEDIPAAYSDKYKISRSVGYGTNTATDMQRIKSLLQMLGYRTATLKDYGSGRTAQSKELIQLKNAIFHFQQTQESLSKDGRVDPNGATWKKMVEVAYMKSGGQEMTQEQIASEHEKRKGSSSDVPADLIANITGGHLLGIDKSGYLIPSEFHARARILKTALETIKGEVGNYSISNAYRSPEHNVKIGSTAGKSQHVQGIAADIQTPSGYTPSTLRSAINQLIESGAIPAGGVGLYSWGVHYDTRGSHVQWS